jgi:hypothetical protein
MIKVRCGSQGRLKWHNVLAHNVKVASKGHLGNLGLNRREARKVRPEEIKQAVKTRYGGYAETGGSKEAC